MCVYACIVAAVGMNKFWFRFLSVKSELGGSVLKANNGVLESAQASLYILKTENIAIKLS